MSFDYKSNAFDIVTVEQVLNKSNGHCWYCGKILTIESRYQKINKDTYAIDHIISKSMGGNSTIDNLVPCCWTCNRHKGNGSLEELRIVKARRIEGRPFFSQKQHEYLEQCGIKLPPLESYVFYFEKMGLKP